MNLQGASIATLAHCSPTPIIKARGIVAIQKDVVTIDPAAVKGRINKSPTTAPEDGCMPSCALAMTGLNKKIRKKDIAIIYDRIMVGVILK